MSNIGTLKKNPPLIGFGDAGENIKHGRFAGAVWTNYPKHFTFIEMHAQIVDSQQRAKALEDTTELEHRAHRQKLPLSPRTQSHPMLGPEDFCGTLADNDAGRRRIAGRYAGHNRSIGNTQLFNPVDFEVTIDYRHGITSHPGGTRLMPIGND
jgi:hypothetical protein